MSDGVSAGGGKEKGEEKQSGSRLRKMRKTEDEKRESGR